MALGFFPWTLLLPGSVLVLARRRPITSPFLVVVLAWVLVVVAVFVGIISSRPVYFLPVYPALALIAAWSWQNAEGRERWWLAAPLGVGAAAGRPHRQRRTACRRTDGAGVAAPWVVAGESDRPGRRRGGDAARARPRSARAVLQPTVSRARARHPARAPDPGRRRG